MPNQTEYIADKELDQELEETLKSNPYFIPVIDHAIVNACFLVRLDDNGEPKEGKGDPITIKKVAAEMKVFTRTDVDFVVIVDKCWWDDVAKETKRGTLSATLMRIDVQKNEGGIVKKLRPFEFKDFVANIKANGTYTEQLQMVKDVLSGKMLDMATAALSRTSRAAEEDDDEPESAPEPEERPRVKAGPMPSPKRSRQTA